MKYFIRSHKRQHPQNMSAEEVRASYSTIQAYECSRRAFTKQLFVVF
ncbi:hypothetical protein [Marinomonas profundi]